MSRPGEEDHDRAYAGRERGEVLQQGAMAERSAVVAWLRGLDNNYTHRLALAVEKGEHLDPDGYGE